MLTLYLPRFNDIQSLMSGHLCPSYVAEVGKRSADVMGISFQLIFQHAHIRLNSLL